MNRTTQRHLMRWLAGELSGPEERELRRRLEADPALSREAERLRRTWDEVGDAADAGGGAGVPPGFAGRVMAHVRDEARSARPVAGGRGVLAGLFGPAAPQGARATAAAALLVGLLLGAGLGGVLPDGAAPTNTTPTPTAAAPPAVAPGSAGSDPAAFAAANQGSDTTADDSEALTDEWEALYYGDPYGGAEAADGGSGEATATGTTFASLGDGYAALLGSPEAAGAVEEGT